ncbi:hypothetical protein ACLB1Q_19020 [Escherichia coli]
MTHSQPIMNVAVDDRLLQREKGMASVQLQNVTKAWGEVVVSKDINLDILMKVNSWCLSDRLAAVNRLYCA